MFKTTNKPRLVQGCMLFTANLAVMLKQVEAIRRVGKGVGFLLKGGEVVDTTPLPPGSYRKIVDWWYLLTINKHFAGWALGTPKTLEEAAEMFVIFYEGSPGYVQFPEGAPVCEYVVGMGWDKQGLYFKSSGGSRIQFLYNFGSDEIRDLVVKAGVAALPELHRKLDEVING